MLLIFNFKLDLIAIGIAVAIVTFSPQVALIADVLEECFPDFEVGRCTMPFLIFTSCVV